MQRRIGWCILPPPRIDTTMTNASAHIPINFRRRTRNLIAQERRKHTHNPFAAIKNLRIVNVVFEILPGCVPQQSIVRRYLMGPKRPPLDKSVFSRTDLNGSFKNDGYSNGPGNGKVMHFRSGIFICVGFQTPASGVQKTGAHLRWINGSEHIAAMGCPNMVATGKFETQLDERIDSGHAHLDPKPVFPGTSMTMGKDSSCMPVVFKPRSTFIMPGFSSSEDLIKSMIKLSTVVNKQCGKVVK